jgi:hypothetical protein
MAIGLACASVMASLTLSGCAGGGGNGDDRIGAFGTGYGSNGTRLLERDGRDRLSAGATDEAGSTGGEQAKDKAGGLVRRGGMKRVMNGPDGVKEADGGRSVGRIESGLSGRLRAGDGSGFPVGNGYDGITPDGAGTSDPKGAAAEGRGGGIALQLGGIRITDTGGIAGDGARVLRVTSPAARRALARLSRNLQSGRPSDRADEIARDLRIVLKDAR